VVDNALGVEHLGDKGLPESRARGPYFRNTLLRGHCLTEHPHLLFLFFFFNCPWYMVGKKVSKSTIGGTFHSMKCSSYE